MIHRIRSIFAGSRWKALVVAAGLTAVAARSASAHPSTLTVDDAWFVTLARAESLLAGASAPSAIDSLDRVDVAAQIQLGVHVLGSLVLAGISADSLLDRPIKVARPDPPKRGWGSRFFKVTGVISSATSLLHLAALLGGASPQTHTVLTYVGVSAAGITNVFHGSKGHAPSNQESESIERIEMVGLVSALRDAIQENERAAESLWQELRVMALDSCATGEQVVPLARHYTNAISAASVLFDSRVARSAAIARSCAQHPGFDKEARERFEALGAHLDAVGVLWQERRWLFERSSRNALDYLVLLDRPSYERAER
jgi:hypothetical protein